jgi:hypothetical protein
MIELNEFIVGRYSFVLAQHRQQGYLIVVIF